MTGFTGLAEDFTFRRIQICCGFSQKILLPPGGTGTLPIAAGFPWFFA